MCLPKETGVHGTLGMVLMAWKFNFKQLLSKTLNSRMNRIKTRAVSNIIKQSENVFWKAKREDLEIILRFLIFGQNKKTNTSTQI